MALPIDVSPYILKGVVSGDSYLTNYMATDEDGDEFIITEFCPSYMVTRDDDGVLVVSETFSREFSADREEFLRRVSAVETTRDDSLHPIFEIFEKNNTAYMVRRVNKLTTIDQYMSGHQMLFDEAYSFIRPLILMLAQVAEQKMFYNLSSADFRVNSYKQLVTCAPPTWDTDFQPTLVQIARLYYKLVTGMEAAEKGAPGFAIYGVEAPARVESMIMEILNGDMLYGSLDDFYKKFKSLIDDTPEGTSTAVKNKRDNLIMRLIAAALVIGLIVGVVFMVQNGVDAFRSNTFWANPSVFVSDYNAPPPDYNFSFGALIHPRNTMDAINGSFALFDGFLFMRNEAGMLRRRIDDFMFIPGATGVLSAQDDQVIIEGTRASFVVGFGPHIYFSDMASSGRMYRAQVNGLELERVTEFPALNLTIADNFLYYTRPDDDNNMHRMNLSTLQHQIVWNTPVFGILAYGENLLFVLSGEPGSTTSGLYVLNLDENTTDLLFQGVNHGLRIHQDYIYFVDRNGTLNRMTLDGDMHLRYDVHNVRSFDVFFQWIVFTEEGRHVPRVYNTNTDEFTTLSMFTWASYVSFHEGMIYVLDHFNSQVVHVYNLPQ